MVGRLFGWMTGRPWVALGILLALTALAVHAFYDFGAGRFRLEIDVSVNRLMPEEDEGKVFYDYTRRLFGNDETMLCALHADDVFTHETLSAVARISERLQEVEGVKTVVSLTNALNIRGTADGIDIRPFVEEVPTDPEELARIRREATENPIYGGNLVSRDGKTTALLIYFLDVTDREIIEKGIDDRIVEIAHEEAGDAEVWLSGGPHLKVAQIRYQQQDLQRSLPLILLVAAAVLGLSFRTIRGVVIPLITVVVSILWTMGIAALIDRPLNLVTVLLPGLLGILGLSYAVHVVSEYYEALRGSPDLTGAQAAERALNHVWLPVALTAFTTAAGFLAMLLSPMSAVVEFGELSVIGITLTLVGALTIPPVLLSLLGRPRLREPAGGSDAFERFAEKVAIFDVTNRRGILIASAVVFVIALTASTQLQVGTNSIENFPLDSSIRLDFDAVNEHLEGANAFNVVLQAEEGRFKEPVNLAAIEDFQAWLEAQPEIGGTTSVVDYIKLINRGFHENQAEYLALPKSARLTGQLLFLGANDELDGFIDRAYSQVNVAVRARVMDTNLVAAVVRRIEARMELFPKHLSGTVTGNPILLNRLQDDIVRGQAYSVLGAVVLIYGILALMFWNLRIGAIAMIPNVLPIAAYFGALGLTGVTLNPATSLIAPMALGVAIDDTIHYFSRFKQEARLLADERQATIAALRSVGRPVTYTSLSICLGFLVFTTSDLYGQIELGALGAFTLGFAWLTDFTLTPALCTGLRFVTLWDMISLDLGHEPEKSIELFRGLSRSQCRVVALMATVREIPAGEPLMRVGEEGQEMYVIIDGKVRIWIEGEDGRQIELNRMGRGEVLGHIGLFHHRRSASVDVIEDARLLRLTENNLDRLSRRYPRIATHVLHNLSTQMADMLLRDTSRIAKTQVPT